MLKHIIKKSLCFVLASVLLISSLNFDVYAEEIVTGESILEEPILEEEILLETESEETPDESPVESLDIESDIEELPEMEDSFGFVEVPGEDFERFIDAADSDDISLMADLPSQYINSNLPLTRNQNPYGSCWAHTTMALSELNLGSNIDLSELHLAYFTYNTPNDPLGGLSGDSNGFVSSNSFLDFGGDTAAAVCVLANWIGAASETVAPYSDCAAVLNGSKSISYDKAYSDVAHIKEFYYVDPVNDRASAKRLIKECGGIGISYYALKSGYSIGGYPFYNVYNSQTNAYYLPLVNGTNHAVTVVGWDDNFSASNFGYRPEGDGAWLVRNSWNAGQTLSNKSLQTYFWLSYYDKTISERAVALKMEDADKYDNNYQYDGTFILGGNYYGSLNYANIFKAKACDRGEVLKAVSFMPHDALVGYTVKVYTGVTAGNPSSGTLKATVTGSTADAGYYKVELPTPIDLEEGELFSVVVSFDESTAYLYTEGSNHNVVNSDGDAWNCNASIATGQSFYGYSNRWFDLATDKEGFGNNRIKAFTVNSNKITVSLDANGGSCSKNYVKLESGSAYGELPVPTRSGYSFDGWYTAQTGGSKITSGTIITNASNHTLYAHWSAGKYTVTFDKNASDATCSTVSKQVTYGNTYGELPTPTRSGYSFDGWYTAPTSGTKIEKSTNVTIVSDQTLYAHWTALKYTVTLDKNASDAICNTSSIQVTFGNTYSSLPAPTRSGYSFDGWYTAQTGGTKIEKTTKVTTAADHTLYAHWSGIKYTVTFNKNASDATCNTASKRVTYGSQYGTLPIPARTGYDFEGWYTLASGGNKVIETTSVETDSNHTLYAHWTACKYTVTFDKNASDATCNTASKQVTFGNEYGELPAPTRTGYEFAGWYTSQTGGTKVEQTSNVKTASNHTLYARWNGYKYTVTFDKNASDVTCNTASKQVTFGSAYGTLPTPTRTGYDFSGWYTDSAAGNAVTSESIVSVLSNHTLYAHWKACEYTVIFDKNASDAECSQTNKQVTYKNTYGELPVPERPGYTFAGWYTSAMGGDLIEADTIVSKTASHRLYARWNGNKYTVYFDQNGADDQSVPAFKEVTYGGTYGDLPIPLRKGYDFAGWYTDSVAGEEIYATTKVPNVSEHTLHAHWMERRGDVTEADTEYLKKKQNGDTSIPEGLWISGIEDGYTYSGSAIKPAVRIFDGDKLLTEKVDYTLTYKNNVNVGNETSCNSKGVSIAPKVVATGKGNYKGAAEEMFNIVPKSIEDPEDIVISDPASVICNNKDQKPVPTVTYGKKKLAVKKDYTVSYYDNTEFTPGSELIPKTPGTYYVLIEAVPGGNYTGSVYKKFIIGEQQQILISKASVQKIKDKTYTGDPLRPDDDEIVVKMGKTVLNEGEDYVVERLLDEECTNVGTVNVKIVGKGNYIGSKSISYKITGIPMSKVTIEGFANSVPYDGIEKCQDNLEVIYWPKGDLVGQEVTYSVSYLNNTNAGTATMILTGTNGYTGTVKKTFKITPYVGDLYSAYLEASSFPYEKSGVKPDVTVSFINGLGEEVLLTQGPDYTVSYSNNTAVNDGNNAKKVPTVKITGKGNFKGINRSLPFSIEPASLKDPNQGIVISAADKVYANKSGNYKQTINVTDGKGKKLALNTDYVIDFTYEKDACVVNGKTKLEENREAGSVVGSNDIVPAGTVINVTVRGTGKTYLAGEEDSITESYRIVQKDFSKLKASVIKKDRPYTGSEIKITKNDISWTGERPSDDDFEIIGYKNNINKGTATVILKANAGSNYGGTKSLTFAIGTKAFSWWPWR